MAVVHAKLAMLQILAMGSVILMGRSDSTIHLMERSIGETQTERYSPTLMKRPIDAILIGHWETATQTGRYSVTLMELYLRTSPNTLMIQMQP
jgi:hypothetical protein